MLCPLDVMGQLVSLQGDLNTEIRKDALRLVQIEDERHPTFLDNRLLEGVEMAYLFQIKTIGESHPVEDCVLLGMGPGSGPGSGPSSGMGPGYGPGSGPGSGFEGEIISIFGALYTTCIQPNKKRRNDFLIGLLKRALQISQLLKIKNQSSGSSPRNIGEKISPYLSKKTKVQSVNENGNIIDNNSNNENNGKEEKSNNYKNNKNYKNNEREREKKKDIENENEKDNNNNNSNNNKNNDMSVDESDHLYSLLSFILTTVSHLPFETVDEPMQVSTVP
jgi:Sister chromatid cohesion C-terminus